MCGIVGYVGPRNCVPYLLEGMKRLEYRGYDSAGIAILDGGRFCVEKCVGKISGLEQKLLQRIPFQGTPGIGHTRWATHGEPSEVNSHPHFDMAGKIAVVHNGIIENYRELKLKLEKSGCHFRSQTDTEVIPHLIAAELASGATSFEDAIRRALRQMRGAYALGIICAERPDTLFAARCGSPLIIATGENNEQFIASDEPAVLGLATEVVYLNDGEIAVLGPAGLAVSNLAGTTLTPKTLPITLQAQAIERGGFETFMLKEIHEQPRVLRQLLDHNVSAEGAVRLPDSSLSREYFRKLNRIMIVSCGTAYHAGMFGKLLLEQYTRIAVETDLASEFRYRDPKVDPGTLVIAVSQSGETADTLASIRMVRQWGCKTLAICNSPGSSLVRESDAVLYTEGGPEIGVASTKAYTAQLMAFCLLAIHIGLARGEIGEALGRELVLDLKKAPDAIFHILSRKDEIRKIAEKHHDGPSSLYLGRRFNYPTALEGALKNKEISYQHAEGYAAGEMKHGPIALVNKYLPVICICTRTVDEVYEKMISNMKEIEARNGRIIALATDGDENVEGLAEDVIYIPPVRDEFSPIVNVVALQLLAYYAAQARGTDIDKPRNLAKSVTVE